MAKAMVIDDSRAIRSILSRILGELGCEVETAAMVRRAWRGPSLGELVGVPGRLEYARNDRAGIRPGTSPGGSLRRHSLMMVTTETEMSQMIRALEAGANEYVMKPFTKT